MYILKQYFSLHLESLDYFSLNKFITQVEYCSCSYEMFQRHIKKNSKNLIHYLAFIGFAHFNTITYSCASDTESYYTLTKICLNSFNEYIQCVEESTFWVSVEIFTFFGQRHSGK